MAALVALLMGLRATEIVSRVVRDVDDDARRLWIPDSKTPAGKRDLRVPVELQPYLRRLAAGRTPDELLFGRHWRDWPRANVKRICRLVGLKEITAHGMRGTNSTIATQANAIPELVSRALGRASTTVTRTNYIAPGTMEEVARQRLVEVLDDGKPNGASKGLPPGLSPPSE